VRLENPEVHLPDEPATELSIIDVTVGHGDEITQADADAGAEVEVHYVGVGQQSKAVFDSSFERGETISFPLNRVIEGWTKGLVGQKVGGRRQITIPGELAYGRRSPTPAIGPNETLVFVVDLFGINR
jgi:peptidylprolyl isomerase